MQTKKKAAIHERKILTDRQLFSLKLLCLRCGQNFIIDQLIGLIKCFDHLGRFRMEIDFIQRFGFGRVPDSAFQDILVDACAVTKAGVGMAGGVGRIGGELPGKLRLALTIFVVRIRLDADFLQERIEFAVTPVSMRRTAILQPMEFMRIDLMYIFILQFVQYRFKHRICFIFSGKLREKCSCQ